MFELRGLSALAVAAALVGCGGSETEEDPPPICTLQRPDTALTEEQEDDDEVLAVQRPMRPSEYAQLVLQNARPGTRVTTDCTGRPIRYEPQDACAASEGGNATAVPLREESIVERRVSPSERLVWIVTHKFPNGDGLGPVALVETQPGRAIIRAMGYLRARPESATLRLTTIGAGDVLVAEGEVCEDSNDASTCSREARLMPLVDRRFLATGMRFPNGECAGPATIGLDAKETVTLETGWERTFKLNASVAPEDSGRLLLQEVIVATDRDPSQPAVPERMFREITTRRTIRHLGPGRLVVSRRSQWREIVAAQGSVEVRAQQAQKQP